MKITNYFVVVILTTLFCSLPAISQTGSLRGKIQDEATGEELIGASVLLEGTTIGIATDLDGKFILNNIPAGRMQ